jgi:hypothetical protein
VDEAERLLVPGADLEAGAHGLLADLEVLE